MLAGQNGSERAVVMDFGLAREVAGPLASTASGVTIPGALVGTPEYMAPEQFENGSLTPATDIYALGVVFYEMLTGERPFAAATPTVAAIRRAKRPPAPSSLQKSVPHFCDRVIDRCLQYDPELRFQSSEELAEAIEHRSFTVSRLKRASGRGRIRRAVVAAANILLVAILVVAGWYWLKDREPSPELRRRSEAQAWYDQALTALRQGAYWKGARALERAVTLDKGFTIAHARLADAWAEQDFTSKAEHEMLVASSPELNRELSPMDRRYVDAIRATLIQDFAAAIEKYREILKDLPQGEKAYGYADLGRAYEKANNVPAALASYRQAANLAPEEPQPFVRLAVLESRQANHDAAATDFKNAEALYNYSSNLEGIAEVDYQRGCAATVEGRLEQAKRYLEASQRVAHQIGSLQLEIRALIRLSTVEYLAGRSQNSTELANTAIRLAQENHLGAPVTDAVIHLGNAYLTGGDYARAEASLRQGLRLAEEGQNPRLVAMAQISLASVLNQQARAAELIPLAQAAFEYYQRTGFVAEATDASILIVRARRDQAQFEEALRSGLRALELAIKYGNKPSILEAEEAVGSVHLEWEQYPAALAHFHSALAVSREIGQLTEYELLHCADALWRLGRYADAQHMLDAIPANARRSVAISTEMSRIAASMRLSQRRYAEALRIARDALKSQPQMAADSRNQLEIASAMAKAKAGVTTQAVETCRQAVDRARRDLDERSVAEANLALAGVYLAAHQPNEARAAAEAARNFFSRSGQKESEWQTLVCLSKAQSGTHDTGGSRTYALSALAILTSFEHNWGTLTYRMYLSRPDVQRDVREMSEVVRN